MAIRSEVGISYLQAVIPYVRSIPGTGGRMRERRAGCILTGETRLGLRRVDGFRVVQKHCEGFECIE